MLAEMVENGRKIEEVKTMQSEIKNNIQGISSEGKEIMTQINNVDHKEETSNQKEWRNKNSEKLGEA